jgi:hypothetical protein
MVIAKVEIEDGGDWDFAELEGLRRLIKERGNAMNADGE